MNRWSQVITGVDFNWVGCNARRCI